MRRAQGMNFHRLLRWSGEPGHVLRLPSSCGLFCYSVCFYPVTSRFSLLLLCIPIIVLTAYTEKCVLFAWKLNVLKFFLLYKSDSKYIGWKQIQEQSCHISVSEIKNTKVVSIYR